jgi:diguanylate cyclase (GGDEF)-like protein
MGKLQSRQEKTPICIRFRNPIQEASFREWEMESSLPVLRPLLVGLGLAFLAFTIPDYIVLGAGPGLVSSVILRAAFLGLAIAVAVRMRKPRSLRSRESELAIVTLCGIGIFGLELFLYRGQNTYIQSMSVMLMIVAVYILPNRLGFSVLMTLVLSVGGILNLLLRENRPSLPATAGIISHFLLCGLLASVLAWRMGRARRLEFLRAEELQSISRTDILTGLPNRRGFEEQLQVAISRCNRHGETGALIMIDIDNFKDVNDQYGHEVGDRVLQEFSQRMRGAIRLSDRPARWGGEEFAIVLPLTGMDEALDMAERLRSTMADYPFPESGSLSASFGVTVIRPDDDIAEAVLRADRALYTAKRLGRNRVASE